MPDIHHFFHVFAGGDWERPVAEHLDALERSGLGRGMRSFNVGVVGPPDDRTAVLAVLEGWRPLDLLAVADDGWEQVTLGAMWWWARHHDGLICYTHTKGAGNHADINDEWRRDMEHHNVFEWRRIVDAFEAGAQVAGAHWITDPASSHAGMFGGNFWWTRAELLRQGCRPGNDYRHRAEEWLGDLGTITPLTGDAVFDLCPTSIAPGAMHPDWPAVV